MYYGNGDDMEYLIGSVNKSGKPHKHKKYEVIVYVEGEGTLYADNKEIKILPNKIVIVPPGVEHYSTNYGEIQRIYINGDFEHLFKFTSTVEIYDNTKREGLSLAKMIYNNRFSNHAYITALINAFAHFLLSYIKIESEISAAIKAVVDEISDNFSNCDLNLCNLLENSGYSEDYIRAQFKKVTSNTPTEYLTKTRISHACYLIDLYKNSIPLNEISEKCGYTDYIYFSRKFKEIMGVSPRKYMDGNII